jgi:hypothetical protein
MGESGDDREPCRAAPTRPPLSGDSSAGSWRTNGVDNGVWPSKAGVEYANMSTDEEDPMLARGDAYGEVYRSNVSFYRKAS